MLKFELRVAWRHLLSGHGQTELTVGAVAVGVVLVVFLSSLINGLQLGLIDDVLGSIPHVVIEAPNPSPKALWQLDGRKSSNTVTRIEKISSRKRKVEQWQPLVETIRRLPDVTAVAPTVEGSGIVGRGAKSVAAHIIGVNPADQMQVTSLRSRIICGDFTEVNSQNAAIGAKMAEELGVSIGDRIRVASMEGIVQTFRVASIFDLGMEQANETWVYMGLASAQGMLNMGKAVTNISVRTRNMFDADAVSDAIRGISSMKVTSWMESNKAFLDTLKAQNSAAVIIQMMTLLASAFGVASVMIVFVVQKSRDIGILKSMGATARQIQSIFMLEGLGVGLGGALLGSGIGTGLCFLAQNIVLPGETFGGKPATIVPMHWDIVYVIAASGVAVIMGLLSSVVPARRAARLHPVEAIRHE